MYSRYGQKVICVLGMHRSGTSCLTGSLEEAGVYLGDIQRKNPNNLKGNCEYLKIMNLHESLFAANGGSWDNPPQEVRWSIEHKSIRDQIVAEYEGVPLWGFKDPRALFTMDGWLEVLPDISFVGTFRHPLAVARSLEKRNGFTLEKGMQIWVAYNRQLLGRYEQTPFPIISFDLPASVYREKLITLMSRLGLSYHSGELSFFEAELRHCDSDEVALPADIQALYAKLTQVAV